jgi:hypothetical protein
MAEKSNLNPQTTDNYSPLGDLATMALRSFGDFSSRKIQGAAELMFVMFANQLIEEVRQHPYWPDDTPIDYYKSATETREIPDMIMVAGLLYMYAMQQKSQIAPTYGQAYARTMNQVLWNRLNGNTAIQLRVQDNGSNENYEQGSASTINGLVSDTDGNVTST